MYPWLYALTPPRSRSYTRTYWLVHAPFPADWPGSLYPLERWHIPYALPIGHTSLRCQIFSIENGHVGKCRGESGWVDVEWAFMVAGGVGRRPVYRQTSIVRRSTAGDHKGPPFPTPPLSPLRNPRVRPAHDKLTSTFTGISRNAP